MNCSMIGTGMPFARDVEKNWNIIEHPLIRAKRV